MSYLRQRRSFAARIARTVWRCVRAVLMAFAVMGPAPPPPPQFRPVTIELREAKGQSLKER